MSDRNHSPISPKHLRIIKDAYRIARGSSTGEEEARLLQAFYGDERAYEDFIHYVDIEFIEYDAWIDAQIVIAKREITSSKRRLKQTHIPTWILALLVAVVDVIVVMLMLTGSIQVATISFCLFICLMTLLNIISYLGLRSYFKNKRELAQHLMSLELLEGERDRP